VSDSEWEDSGAMWLTGRADGEPLIAPGGVVAAIRELGIRAGVDALSLLGERAAIAGSSRGGTTSCGGGTRLVRAADGNIVAVSLARPDDVALLPAWVGVDEPRKGVMDDSTWEAVGAAVGRCPAREIVERAALLGLAVSRLGEVTTTEPVIASSFGAVCVLERAPVVVDLSSLWAGPLATRLLLHSGARVIKVESLTRPDGARRGEARFFDLMNAGKQSVALDFHSQQGREHLRGLLHAADVVVEASRPRALEQLGIDARSVIAEGPRVWVSITGYGRDEPGRHRTAFGDDAAVAGGLVADAGDGPCFVADAVADPLTGVVVAAAVRDTLRSGARVLLDVALARVAANVARCAGEEPWSRGDEAVALRPVAAAPAGRAPRLGEHTDAVVRELLG
jgi:hypothetical protein